MCSCPPASGPLVLYAWDTDPELVEVSRGTFVLGSLPVAVLGSGAVEYEFSSSLWKCEP